VTNVMNFLNNEKALEGKGKRKVKEAKYWWAVWKEFYVLYDGILRPLVQCKLTFMRRKCTSGELVAIVLFYSFYSFI